MISFRTLRVLKVSKVLKLLKLKVLKVLKSFKTIQSFKSYKKFWNSSFPSLWENFYKREIRWHCWTLYNLARLILLAPLNSWRNATSFLALSLLCNSRGSRGCNCDWVRTRVFLATTHEVVQRSYTRPVVTIKLLAKFYPIFWYVRPLYDKYWWV